MKKRGYILPIVIGFSVLYLFSMGLSTYFMAEHFRAQFDYEYANVMDNMQDYISALPEYMVTEMENRTSFYKNNLGLYISQITHYLTAPEYQKYSLAVYDPDGSKVAQSGNYIQRSALEFSSLTSILYRYYCYCLDDYLNDEDIDQLKKYYLEANAASTSTTERSISLYLSAGIDTETKELLSLSIMNTMPDETMDSEMDALLTEPLWSWQNPDYDMHDGHIHNSNVTKIRIDGNLVFPYLYYGEKQYEQWRADEYLHAFPETRAQKYSTEPIKNSTLFNEYGEKVQDLVFPNTSTENKHLIVLRSTSKPLVAAMDYLKYIYLISFLVMLACMLKVIYSATKNYKQQLFLEETRQNFTNMITQDLEIPLNHIRELAEKVQENVASEQRAEHLNKIIEETEVMDDMIQQMIVYAKQDTMI